MMLLELFDAKQLLEARKDALLHETVTEVVCPDPILGGTLRIRFDGKALKEKFG